MLEQVVMNLAVNARDAMPKVAGSFIGTGGVELDQDYAASIRKRVPANSPA